MGHPQGRGTDLGQRVYSLDAETRERSEAQLASQAYTENQGSAPGELMKSSQTDKAGPALGERLLWGSKSIQTVPEEG